MAYLINLFEQHSYLILFFGIFLELMALPISGEFLMSYAGYFVYLGKMNYYLALLTVFLSGGVGITLTYWIGKVGGYKLIEKYGKYIHLGPGRYQKVSDWFERSGSKLLIFAYFIPGVRHFTGYISGISRMSFRKFIIPAYFGSFLWGFCFITLGKVLGPQWEVFHQAARKYFVIFIILFVLFFVLYLFYRSLKEQIKVYLIHLLQRLMNRLKTLRATEIFLIVLSIAFIGLVTLMLGLAQDYVYSEFTQFNKITAFIIHFVVYQSWMKEFLIFQNLYVLGFFLAITIISVWRKGQNRGLEYLLLTISILGSKTYLALVSKIFTYLESFGYVGRFHSTNFPDEHTTLMVIIYVISLYLLVRHMKSKLISILIPLFGLIIFIGLAITNIEITKILPSDIVGGYVYGGVWLIFNFLLFELSRLALKSSK